MKKLKYSELFCGPGGMALGAKLASDSHPKIKIEHLWATDYDKDACRTYAHNICKKSNDKSVICADVRELDFKKLEHPDILSFGFPCNDFSLVGEQKGIDGKFGPLYSYCVKGLNQLNPLVFVAENVSGIQSSNGGNSFKKILSELENSGQGYNLNVNHYYFENYGIPQSRHRFVIVGFRRDTNLIFKVPKETHSVNNYKTCQNAIDYPPISHDAYNHELTKNTKVVVERLSHIPEGKNIWDVQDNDKFPEHLKLNVKGARLSQIYRKLDSKKPSYTVTGSGGGGTHIYHWNENRALTNRERARLQTFPDNHEFIGSKESVRKQIGMAVPVEGSKIIFNAILNTISGMKYPTM